MEETIYRVYMHTCPNNKKYVGMTSRKPERRWRNGYGYKGYGNFWLDIQTFGWDNIEHTILKENLTQEEAQYWEKYYIKKFNTTNPEFGYNKSEGGEYCPSGWHHIEEAKEKSRQANLGKKHSKEEKEKISQSNLGKHHHTEDQKKKQSERMRGKKHPMYGKKQSEEAKEKCRQAQLGKKRSEESKEKNRQAHLGKKESEETKKKKRQARLGRHFYNNGEITVSVYECPDGFVPGRLRRKQNN